MSLLQLGEVDKLLVDPAVWLCFNCADCTSGCPAEAGPGRGMAAIRRLAVERYSVPRGWGRGANQPLGVLSVLFAALGAARAWRAFTGEALWMARVGRLLRSVGSVARQIATHQQFSECRQFPLSRWAHISLSYGFLTLLALAGVAAVRIAVHAPYPLPASHPLKIAGNLAAALMIGGGLCFLGQL